MKNLDSILTKAGYIYLVLPFFIFSATWLSIPFAVLVCAITVFSLFFVLKNVSNDEHVSALLLQNKRQIFYALFFLAIIMFFSGIGSYTFQNQDHLYRNAIFRDLVTYKWPVIYHVEGFGTHQLEGKTTMMTYYLGYFLPPALLGKLFGFEVAKFALLLWTYIGLVLILFQVGKYLNRFNLKVILLFMGWGTLFFLGAMLKYPFLDLINEKQYLWAGMILYMDSNLGGIYWTFNQTITAWLILGIFINQVSRRNIVFLYSLSFFLSPFAFLGMLPFVLWRFIKDSSSINITSLLDTFKSYLSFQNVAGAGTVMLLNYLYISSNPASNFFQTIHTPWHKMVVFMLISWVAIAALIYPLFKKDSLYWLIVAVLIPLPFFQLGYGIDFPGRVSIPAFFILMLLVGKFLIEHKHGIRRNLVMSYMIICFSGHFFMETVRSIGFTAFENISHHTQVGESLAESENPTLQNIGEELIATKNKNILIKDYGTVLNPKNEVIWNYMADVEQSKFYKWVARK